jgi:hypothetical protein
MVVRGAHRSHREGKKDRDGHFRARTSGDLTISGVFPGETTGIEKMRKAITWMHTQSDHLIAFPIFPGKGEVSSPADMAPPGPQSVP